MWVRTRISDGRVVSARAACSARVDRGEIVAVGDRSRVPAIGLEAPRAILGERDVGAGGSVTWLSSYRQISLPSRRCPASEAASEATPSIRSPSLTIA